MLQLAQLLSFRGSFTFTLTDFGSSASLSTLHVFRYLETRKTRYMMELTTTFMTGLSPARFVRLSWRTYTPYKQWGDRE